MIEKSFRGRLERKLVSEMVEVGSRERLVWPDEIGSPQHGASPHVLSVCAFITRASGTAVVCVPGLVPTLRGMEGVLRRDAAYKASAIECSDSE